MFLRESRHTHANGETVVYLQLVQSVWNPEAKRAETRVIYNCGRAGDDATTGKLRDLAKSILNRVTFRAQWRSQAVSVAYSVAQRLYGEARADGTTLSPTAARRGGAGSGIPMTVAGRGRVLGRGPRVRAAVGAAEPPRSRREGMAVLSSPSRRARQGELPFP
jgi:hypothetical protein